MELADINFSHSTDDLRPAIDCVDVNGLEIDNFKAQLAEGAAASKFENVSGVVIRNSPVRSDGNFKLSNNHEHKTPFFTGISFGHCPARHLDWLSNARN